MVLIFNVNIFDLDGNSILVLLEFLILVEEFMLVGYYILEIFCVLEVFYYVDEIKVMVVMFLKRFYIINSIMMYLLVEMFFVVLFFVCKVDMGYVNLVEYIKIFNKFVEEIFVGEFFLC